MITVHAELTPADGAVTMCGDKSGTGCPSTIATCCHHNFSKTTWGCCPFPNAVCCAGSYGLCCPSGTVCHSTGSFSGTCIQQEPPAVTPTTLLAAGATPATSTAPPPDLHSGGAPQVCTPGAMDPPSVSIPSAIIIGDSVSIGYTPHVAAALSGKVQVQHSPAAGGGGADDAPYGKQCIITLESFLRTADYRKVKWDLITFNFGLHDMDNSTGGLHSIANYTAQLEEIADKLIATGSKLLYVATTPYMPNHLKGDGIVEVLNAKALMVANARGIPYVDLYTRVTDKCGKSYATCPICLKDPCAFHYTQEGYEWIQAPLSAAILNATRPK
eukprot:gene6593-6147_t